MATRLSYFLHILVLWHFTQCDGKCSDIGDGGEGCWYTLWYLWFILVLFFIGVSVLVMFYCKVRAKNRVTSISGGRRNNVMVAPVQPPPYSLNDPGSAPPSYHTAMATQSLPPGYVGEPPRYQTRAPSSMSILSNPPPYSPPRR
ncbi:uncharacterized protein LOC124258927 [Haliotis rubra]|uniref:uncharacterized protein LOC124258927 n=1 Tax=Haliotis rubra TaxID=36100 RepID=UPI001EE51666|nr:uncharacterized protein LOC124258927 [Haliotis rubra]